VSYFTAPFLAAALVIGYLMFFLFFYGTEYWGTVDSLERFFFGFLIGIFAMIICTLVSVPLALFLYSLYLQQLFTYFFYLIPISVLMFLILLRVGIKAPLSGKKANRLLWDYVENHKSYWPYLLMTISVGAFLLLRLNNPFFDSASLRVWGGFIFLLNLTVFIWFCVLAWFVVQLSSIPTNISLDAVFGLMGQIVRFYFLPFRRKKKAVSTRERDVYWV
jgi:hypothetical protein